MTNKEAIDAIRCNYPPSSYSMLREALDMSLLLLEQQEKERWIPVSERLPKEVMDVYQVTINRKDDNYKWVQPLLWYNGEWKWWEEDEYDLDEEQYEVLAWKPMPEVYKEEGNHE